MIEGGAAKLKLNLHAKKRNARSKKPVLIDTIHIDPMYVKHLKKKVAEDLKNKMRAQAVHDSLLAVSDKFIDATRHSMLITLNEADVAPPNNDVKNTTIVLHDYVRRYNHLKKCMKDVQNHESEFVEMLAKKFEEYAHVHKACKTLEDELLDKATTLRKKFNLLKHRTKEFAELPFYGRRVTNRENTEPTPRKDGINLLELHMLHMEDMPMRVYDEDNEHTGDIRPPTPIASINFARMPSKLNRVTVELENTHAAIENMITAMYTVICANLNNAIIALHDAKSTYTELGTELAAMKVRGQPFGQTQLAAVHDAKVALETAQKNYEVANRTKIESLTRLVLLGQCTPQPLPSRVARKKLPVDPVAAAAATAIAQVVEVAAAVQPGSQEGGSRMKFLKN